MFLGSFFTLTDLCEVDKGAIIKYKTEEAEDFV